MCDIRKYQVAITHMVDSDMLCFIISATEVLSVKQKSFLLIFLTTEINKIK